MYVTPRSHRIMTKDSVVSADGAESLVTKTNNHFVSAVQKHSLEVLQQPGILKM